MNLPRMITMVLLITLKTFCYSNLTYETSKLCKQILMQYHTLR